MLIYLKLKIKKKKLEFSLSKKLKKEKIRLIIRFGLNNKIIKINVYLKINF